MSRSFVALLFSTARERARAQARLAREIQQSQRHASKLAREADKAQKKANVEWRIQQTQDQNNIIRATVRELSQLLVSRLSVDSRPNFLKARREVDQHNSGIEDFVRRYNECNSETVVEYFELVLIEADFPGNFPQVSKVAFISESRQLVVEH